MFGKRFLIIAFGVATTFALGSVASASPICPTTANTNTDCGYLLTIGAGGAVTGAPVMGANPYDGSDDALIGVINNSGSAFNGSITISGSGNGGGLFGFDGDGICTFTNASYCSNAATGYEGPLNTFTNYATTTSGTVVFTGLAAGATTFFSLEGSPASIKPIVGSPEPGTIMLLGGGFSLLALLSRRKRIS